MSRGSASRTSIALSETALTVLTGHAASWRIATAQHDASRESIGDALDSLAANIPAGTQVDVTLLRPIAQLKTIVMPAMPRAALERVLGRDWVRHIVGFRSTPHSVTAERADRGRWRAAFAPGDVLDAITRVATERGWELHVRTADDALASAALSLAPADVRAGDAVVVVCDEAGPSDACLLRNGKPWLGKHLLSRAPDELLSFVRSAPVEQGERIAVIILGEGAAPSALARSLGQDGIRARALPLPIPAGATANTIVAYAATLAPPALPLRTSAMRDLRSHQLRVLTRWMFVAAAALVLLALGMERFRVARELAALKSQRAAISAQVGKAITVRADLANVMDAASELTQRESNATRTTSALTDIALALPPSASFTAVQVNGDSVVVEGESQHSAEVYNALRALPLLRDVRLAAPLRQERQGLGTTTVEHFAFIARLREVAR